jgi:hypothetical protein
MERLHAFNASPVTLGNAPAQLFTTGQINEERSQSL